MTASDVSVSAAVPPVTVPPVIAPSVSVVVVSYYTGPLLWRCVAAALGEPEVTEVIVVDNGNWDAARADLALMAEDEPRLRVIEGQGNVGFAAGCNLGARAARAGHLFLLNPDAVLPRGAAGTLLREGKLAGGEGPWVVGGRLLNPDGTEQAGARRGPLTPWTALVEMTKLYRLAPRHPYFRRFNNHHAPCPGRTVPMPVISGACMLMPLTDYRAVGGMDEDFFLHVEDVDFCLRFSAAGGSVLYAPMAEIVHVKSSSRVSAVRVERWKSHSLVRYFRRHFSDVYPPGFVELVCAMVWGVFAVRACRAAGAHVFGLLGLGHRAGVQASWRAARITARGGRR